jgi:hypothetical protein
MSAPMATLERLARVRERLRDVAAAAAAACESAESAARAAVAAARRAEEAELDRSPVGARSVRVLVEQGEALESAKAYVAEAHKRVAERQSVSRQAAAELGTRERALRGAERMLEVARTAREQQARRAEQRLSDDLASVRRR